MEKHKLDLTIALPRDATECDACIERLLSSVRTQPGIRVAHIDRSDPELPKLCLHVASGSIKLAELEGLIRDAGAKIETHYEHINLAVTGLRHERQARLVEGYLLRVDGITHAALAVGAKRAFLEFDPQKVSLSEVKAALHRSGLRLPSEPLLLMAPDHDKANTHEHEHDSGVCSDKTPHSHAHGHSHDHSHGGIFGERTELIFAIGTGVMALSGWIAAKMGAPAAVYMAAYLFAYLLGAWFTAQEVFLGILARRFEVDLLMLTAATGAAILGEWFEGALLLALFSLGHSLEGYAMRRAHSAIDALSTLTPETAHRFVDDDTTEEVPIEEIVIGDRVLVRPDSRVPSDGFVVDGESGVDQAPITGESVPVDKFPVADVAAALARPERVGSAHVLFAGTINGAGALTMVVTRHSTESTLARVASMISEAESERSPTQQFAANIERYFVPGILLVVVGLLFAWLFLDEPFSASFYRAMAVLVAASPCALAISTPSAILAGIARAAREGVLIKGGAHLENLGGVSAIALDKTGTLTIGRPKLTDLIPAEGGDEQRLLAVAAALESGSDHPLASAIVDGYEERNAGQALPMMQELRSHTGKGISGMVDGAESYIGKPAWFEEDGSLPADLAAAAERLRIDGRTIMIVKHGDSFLGAIGVMDTLRAEAPEVVTTLHEIGVRKTLILSGDHQSTVDAIGKLAGISEVHGGLMPEDKVTAIAALSAERGGVAMVGDGVNDAPAMARATVGIAMGARSSDVALETADIALLGDDLRNIPFAIQLSRSTSRIIRQNLWISLGMVALLVPATAFGFAKIGVAVVLHEGSTLAVVANALRLLGFKSKHSVKLQA